MKKKKPGIKKLIEKLDKICSEYIRRKANYSCERCFNKFNQNVKYGLSGLDTSHYMGRGNKSTRFEEDNMDSLCMGCHAYFEDRKQTEYRDWKIKKIGKERVEEIEFQSRQPKQWKTWELEEVIEYYRNKILGEEV